ncbi:hypothetical protein [Tolypothrix sp. VBCCA 56010]
MPGKKWEEIRDRAIAHTLNHWTTQLHYECNMLLVHIAALDEQNA